MAIIKDRAIREASVRKAYMLMRSPQNLSLTERLDCHALILREPQPIDKSQAVAEAIADICDAVHSMMLLKKLEIEAEADRD